MLTHRLFVPLFLIVSNGCAVTTPRTLAAGNNAHFFHQESTNRPPEAIWRLWVEPATWPQWDPETERVELDGSFSEGATGRIKGVGAPEARFEITRFEAGRRYEFSTVLPLGGRLVILRELEVGDGVTRFKHDVRFEGFGGWLLAPIFGPKYRAALPVVLERIKALAEKGAL